MGLIEALMLVLASFCNAVIECAEFVRFLISIIDLLKLSFLGLSLIRSTLPVSVTVTRALWCDALSIAMFCAP